MIKYTMFSIVLLSLLFYACRHTHGYSQGTTLLVSLMDMNIVCEATHPKIRIGAGSHQLISDCTYRLVFEKTNGGSTFFLGKKVKKSNPWTNNRMVLTINSTEYKFSIEDIKNMPTIIEGDSVVYQMNIH